MPFSLKAQTINVDLGDNTPRNLNGPASGAGRVWNTWEPLDEVLRDIEGNTTSVKVITDGSGPYGDWWSDLRLLTAGFASPLGEDKKTVSIVGLKPDSAYDLYVASAWGQRSSNTRFTLVNSTSSLHLQPADRRDASRYPYTEQIVEYSIDLETWVSIEVPAMSDISLPNTTPSNWVKFMETGTLGPSADNQNIVKGGKVPASETAGSFAWAVLQRRSWRAEARLSLDDDDERSSTRV